MTQQMIQQPPSLGRVPAMQAQPGFALSLDHIDAFLNHLNGKGCRKNSLDKYRHDLTLLHSMLPEGKQVGCGTLVWWRTTLLQHGYAVRTINSYISEANGLLAFLGRREFQLPGALKISEDESQPELKRAEYLRLLSAARALGKERTYLLVKVFAATGMAVQELPDLTVESVNHNRVAITSGMPQRILHLPAVLREELLQYIHRAGIASGPVFISRTGRRLNRTAVTAIVQELARDARVPPEKCTPRCLRKLYQSTMARIADSVQLLIEQSHECLLEQEQLIIGWEDGELPTGCQKIV